MSVLFGINDWLNYIDENGKEQFGKVENIERDEEKQDTRFDLKLLNGTKTYIFNDYEWSKVPEHDAIKLDIEYNKLNNNFGSLEDLKNAAWYLNEAIRKIEDKA